MSPRESVEPLDGLTAKELIKRLQAAVRLSVRARTGAEQHKYMGVAKRYRVHLLARFAAMEQRARTADELAIRLSERQSEAREVHTHHSRTLDELHAEIARLRVKAGEV